jgi:hypothetical protein
MSMKGAESTGEEGEVGVLAAAGLSFSGSGVQASMVVYSIGSFELKGRLKAPGKKMRLG